VAAIHYIARGRPAEIYVEKVARFWTRCTVRKLQYLFLFVSASTIFLIIGGLIVELAIGISPAKLGLRWLILGAAAIRLARSTRFLRNSDGRRFVFAFGFFILISAVSLAAMNAAAALVVPRWPANALHGAVPKAYWRDKSSSFTSFNSWGQRDREHAVRPAPGTQRIAFVGDSFLEESDRPLSMVVEEKMRPPFEVINLGVSNSGPDSYFYRVKNVALPLGCRHVVMFYFESNDTLRSNTLENYWGIAAVYPHDSLLSKLHLLAINHALTNRRRPFMQAWGAAAETVQREQALVANVAQAGDAALSEILLSMVNEPFRPKLAGILRKPEAATLFNAIRNPDDGLFRTYLLSDALQFAAGQRGPHGSLDEGLSFGWVKRAADLCRERKVKFTLVIVGDPFHVDGRVRDQYAVLGDMRKLYQERYQAADNLMKRARKARLDVVDLRPVFKGKRGTYLNFDGHWSVKGLNLAADTVTAALKERHP
jgi:hypothetical protein